MGSANLSLLNNLVNKVKGNTPSDPAIPPDDFIKNIVDEADREPIQNRAATFSGYVHVSSLAKSFCARQYSIAIHENLSLYETVSGGMRVVWAQGRASEDHLRSQFIAKYGARNIYARWTCETNKEDHDFYQGMFKPGQKCKCGAPINFYNEAHLYDHNSKVVGRPDLIFRYQNWLNVVEIKSIKKTSTPQHVGFEDLEKPIQDHIDQAGFYPDLLRKTEPTMLVSPYVRYAYIAKEFMFTSPYKEFVVDVEAIDIVANREELYTEAKQVQTFLETKELPPRICPVFSSPMAKKCAVNARCFYTYQDKV